MNTAFEVTIDDVANVLTAHNLNHDAAEIHSQLDFDAIEEAALYGNDMEEQTNYAYQTIEDQLKEMGFLGIAIETKYPVV